MSSPRIAAVKASFERFGLETPRIYYPACGDDEGFDAIGKVLYVDPYSRLPQAVRADAETYEVTEPVNAVAFFHAPPFEERVLSRTNLVIGGIVLWSNCNRVRPPLDGPVLNRGNLVGLMKENEDRLPYIEDRNLDEYFRLKSLSEMNDSLRLYIEDKFNAKSLEIPADPELFPCQKTPGFSPGMNGSLERIQSLVFA